MATAAHGAAEAIGSDLLIGSQRRVFRSSTCLLAPTQSYRVLFRTARLLEGLTRGRPQSHCWTMQRAGRTYQHQCRAAPLAGVGCGISTTAEGMLSLAAAVSRASTSSSTASNARSVRFDPSDSKTFFPEESIEGAK